MSNLNDIAGIPGAGPLGGQAQTVVEQTITTKPLKIKEQKAETNIESLQAQLLQEQLETARLNREAAQLAVESASLEIKEKNFNIRDLRERLEERELKSETKKQRSLNNGATLRQIDRTESAAQKRCNHRKGGMGAAGVMAGQGDSSNMAVIKHTFANGDMWVRCQRCGKTWKPPIERLYATRELYLIAFNEYQAAVNFQTTNTASSSYLFKFSDNGDYYREVTANTTLR